MKMAEQEVAKITNSFKRVVIKSPEEKEAISQLIRHLEPIFVSENEGFVEKHYNVSGVFYSVISSTGGVGLKVIEQII